MKKIILLTEGEKSPIIEAIINADLEWKVKYLKQWSIFNKNHFYKETGPIYTLKALAKFKDQTILMEANACFKCDSSLMSEEIKFTITKTGRMFFNDKIIIYSRTRDDIGYGEHENIFDGVRAIINDIRSSENKKQSETEDLTDKILKERAEKQKEEKYNDQKKLLDEILNF